MPTEAERQEFHKKVDQEFRKTMSLSRGVHPHEGMVEHLARTMRIGISQARTHVNWSTHDSAAQYVHDYTSNFIFDKDINQAAWLKEWRKDPWVGHPGVPWMINGYAVDDAISDVLTTVRQGGSAQKELERLIERLRGRTYDRAV